MQTKRLFHVVFLFAFQLINAVNVIQMLIVKEDTVFASQDLLAMDLNAKVTLISFIKNNNLFH